MAQKAVARVQPPSATPGTGTGDVIELTDAFEAGMEFDGGRGGDENGNGNGNGEDASLDLKAEERLMLRERFPPRGRVFEESGRKK